jgi:hypothetical protein
MSTEATMYDQQHDKKIASNQVHAKKKETKKKGAMTKLAIINYAWAKEVPDKKQGHAYQSRMAAPTTMMTTADVRGKEEEVIVEATAPDCGACGNYGHQRQTSHLRTQNTRSKNYQGTYVD